MQATPLPTSQVEGFVERVDLVNRELTVRAGDERVKFDVPTDCAILLRGERVKLRLMQLHDCVRLTYTERRGLRAAWEIEIEFGCGTDRC